MLSSVVIERIDNSSVQVSFDNDQLEANCTIGVSFLIFNKHTHVAYCYFFQDKEIIKNLQDINRITLNWRSTNLSYFMTFNFMSEGIVAETTLTGISKLREDVYLMIEFKNGLRISSTTHLTSKY